MEITKAGDFTSKTVENKIKEIDKEYSLKRNQLDETFKLLESLRLDLFSLDKLKIQMLEKYKQMTGKNFLDFNL